MVVASSESPPNDEESRTYRGRELNVADGPRGPQHWAVRRIQLIDGGQHAATGEMMRTDPRLDALTCAPIDALNQTACHARGLPQAGTLRDS